MHLYNEILSIFLSLTTSYIGILTNSAVESEVQSCNEHTVTCESLISQKLNGISVLPKDDVTGTISEPGKPVLLHICYWFCNKNTSFLNPTVKHH